MSSTSIQDKEALKAFFANPQSLGCRLHEFSFAELVPGPDPGSLYLAVIGTRTMVNSELLLLPRFLPPGGDPKKPKDGEKKPPKKPKKYGNVELVAYIPAKPLAGILPFAQTLEVRDIIGTKGIRLFGGNNQLKTLDAPAAFQKSEAPAEPDPTPDPDPDPATDRDPDTDQPSDTDQPDTDQPDNPDDSDDAEADDENLDALSGAAVTDVSSGNGSEPPPWFRVTTP